MVNLILQYLYKHFNPNDDYDGQMIFGDLGGLKFPDICLTSEEKPRKKNSPRKPVPTGDRTRARCETSAHATTFSTAVYIKVPKYLILFSLTEINKR